MAGTSSKALDAAKMALDWEDTSLMAGVNAFISGGKKVDTEKEALKGAEMFKNFFAHEKKKILGIKTAASGAGAAAVIALTQAVWGQGEKELGSSWNQIFSTSGEFADATSVSDLPAIVHSLAETFGHKVNTAALSL